MSDVRILVVEDERALARGLEYSLKKEGYQVLWAETGSRPIHTAAHHHGAGDGLSP